MHNIISETIICKCTILHKLTIKLITVSNISIIQ